MTHPSEATSDIWENWPRFEMLANTLEVNARRLETAAVDKPVAIFKDLAGK